MRAPRTRFAASLVVTLAAAGCGRTVDHREPVHPNPPPVTDNNDTSRAWNVIAQDDGTCLAETHIDCPPAPSTCNPPAPMHVACPDGAATIHYTIHETSPGTCELVAPMADCPAGMRCNPPPPRKVDCPHY
jgi:hypothetical protein